MKKTRILSVILAVALCLSMGVTALAEGGVSVTYDLNGGTGTAPAAGTYEPGEEITVQDLENGFPSGNHEFICWSTAADGSGDYYEPGDALVIGEEDITLYAIWGGFHVWYVNGYDNGTFGPGSSLTRGEMAMMLYRLSADPDKDTADVTSSFTDVQDSGKWYYHPVAYLEAAGVLKGYDAEDGTQYYAPEKAITRAEMAVLLTRIHDVNTSAPGTATFSDLKSSHWAYNAITNAADCKWIEGYEDGTARPDNEITRAEAVTMINRSMDRANGIIYPEDFELGYPDVPESEWYYDAVAEASYSHYYFLVRDNDGNLYEVWILESELESNGTISGLMAS